MTESEGEISQASGEALRAATKRIQAAFDASIASMKASYDATLVDQDIRGKVYDIVSAQRRVLATPRYTPFYSLPENPRLEEIWDVFYQTELYNELAKATIHEFEWDGSRTRGTFRSDFAGEAFAKIAEGMTITSYARQHDGTVILPAEATTEIVNLVYPNAIPVETPFGGTRFVGEQVFNPDGLIIGADGLITGAIDYKLGMSGRFIKQRQRFDDFFQRLQQLGLARGKDQQLIAITPDKVNLPVALRGDKQVVHRPLSFTSQEFSEVILDPLFNRGRELIDSRNAARMQQPRRSK